MNSASTADRELLPLDLGSRVPSGLRVLEFVDNEGRHVPFVASPMGRPWKLIKDPNLPDSGSQHRVYRVDGFCPAIQTDADDAEVKDPRLPRKDGPEPPPVR
eukprot:CAMPEP_0172192930 /NCGR_PEP_ID=MMETSP1050-20130122/24641_1 /TAXON_ID=233186 /ORGANISM="Cryptomonas curvata, Strain CCAP979/52" /LENGTH=101 /DNA_ID=CAMNT_0012868367 /DNA_START=92 /DNA_END=394 /DNA_ORIENTATION=+